MPRRFIRKITPSPESMQSRWYLRPFGKRVADPAIWSLQRRSITGGFGAGLAICFVPLPIHFVLAIIVALMARVNAAVIFATVLIINPVTIFPIYYFAYRVGAWVLRKPPGDFHFELSWDWLQHGLGPMWKPFLLGCLICGAVAGVVGWFTFEMLWRWHVRRKYRNRGLPASP